MNFIKEIEKHLKSEASNTEKITALCNLVAPKLMYIPVPQAVMISLRMALFQKQFEPSSDNFYVTQFILAFLEYRQQNFNDAIALVKYLDDWDYSDFESKNISLRKVVCGICQRSLGQLDEALQSFQKVVDKEIEVAKVEKYQSFLYGLALYHITEMYGEMSDYVSMLKRAKQLLPYSLEIENVDLNNRCLNSIGRAYLNLEDFDNALEYLKKADVQSRKAGNNSFISRNLNDLGAAFAEQKEYDLSLAYYQQALDLRQKTKNSSGVITTLMSMSAVHVEQKAYGQAIELLQNALRIAVPLKVNSKIYKIYQAFSKIYELQGEFEKSLIYFKKFYELKEEVENIGSIKVENQRIREKNSQLRRQKNLIAVQKQQIETSIKKLTEANRYLENFATVAAHDLKAPMRIAGNFSKIIENKYKTLIDDEDKEFLTFISDNMSRLSKMIDDLLSLSKIDQNLPVANVVDTQNILNDALLRLNTKIKTYQAEIVIQNQLPKIIAHPSLVTQLFQNLIDNAMKHSYTDDNFPKVQVLTRLNLANPAFQEFEVKDNGKGIPVHLQPHIFELFSGASRTDSTGIGLATCKKIVQHYGGEIWVASEENQGTSMFFTLPAYKV